MSDPTTPIGPASVVVVSGGSRGLGLAIVKDILASGAKVAAFARTVTDELRALADDNPGRVLAASVDVNDATAVTAFIKEAESTLGPVDALVNNAAVGQDSMHIHTSPQQIADIIQTNLTSPLVVTRAVLRRMMARGGRGRVVMVTSVCAQRGYSGLVTYAATKGGLDSAMRTLAREMHGRALVNSVAPGFFASEMSSVLGDQQLETIARRTPSGRMVEPDNIVPVVHTLLFEDTNLNGQVITIDGGSSI